MNSRNKLTLTIVLAGLLLCSIPTPQCHSRRSQYLMGSKESNLKVKSKKNSFPVIKQMIGKQKVEDLKKEFASIEQEIEQQLKEKKEMMEQQFQQEGQQLESEKTEELDLIRQKHEALMKEMQENYSRQRKIATSNAMDRAEQLKKERNQADARLASNAKVELLRAYKEKIKLIEAALIEQAKPIELWKATTKEKLSNAVTYLKQLFEEDDQESRDALSKKASLIDLTITDTNTMKDEQYQQATQAIKPLLMLYEHHKMADTLLTKWIKSTGRKMEAAQLPATQYQPIRRTILYQLPALVQNMLNPQVTFSEQDRQAEIQKIVMSAINEAGLSEAGPTDLRAITEKLQNEVAQLEQQLQQEQATTQEALDQNKQLEINNKQLEIKSTQLESKSIKLTQNVEHLTSVTGTLKNLNQKLQRNLETTKMAWQQEAKKQMRLTIELEKHQKQLATSQLSEKEKALKIKELQPYLQKASHNEILANIEAAKVKVLQTRLHAIEEQSQASRNRTQGQIKELTYQRAKEKRTFQIKKEILEKTKARLRQENFALQKQWQENTRLRSSIEQLTKDAKNAKQDAIRSKIREEIAIRKELLATKRKLANARKRQLQVSRKNLKTSFLTA